MNRPVILTAVTAVLGLNPALVIAGAGNAELHCKAKTSGYVGMTISGSIPGDLAEFDLQIKSASGVVVMTNAKEKISVITAFDQGVFTVAVTLPDSRDLLLYAVPKTVKSQGGSRREVTASFDAMLIEGPKPGYKGPVNYESMIRDVLFRCTFEHSV